VPLILLHDMLQPFRPILIFICSSLLTLLATSQSTHPLFTAVRDNDINKIKTLFDDGKADVTLLDDDSDNVLMYAALSSSADVMELLLKKGAKINGRNKAGETALMWSMHDKDKVALLLKYGADINAAARSGNTSLLIGCVGKDQYEIVKMLLDAGANVSAKNNEKETALMRAALFGDTATISLLINKGIDINARNAEGHTALVQAIENSNRQVALQLLGLGADPDLPFGIFPSSLCVAVLYGDIEIVNAILKKTKNVIGIKASLLFAVYNEHDNVKIVQALLDKGADVNMKAPDGSTVLSQALKKGNTATVALLRQAGAK
jgi:ankyrin repeat protein